ncbi:MAG: hypothetical protein CM15mP54_14170 [Paracoccaceae bacterium]|nr:MAG: hypothetical protein CM15mP54_14170 [Paracoccaceae bacterium]
MMAQCHQQRWKAWARHDGAMPPMHGRYGCDMMAAMPPTAMEGMGPDMMARCLPIPMGGWMRYDGAMPPTAMEGMGQIMMAACHPMHGRMDAI